MYTYSLISSFYSWMWAIFFAWYNFCPICALCGVLIDIFIDIARAQSQARHWLYKYITILQSGVDPDVPVNIQGSTGVGGVASSIHNARCSAETPTHPNTGPPTHQYNRPQLMSNVGSSDQKTWWDRWVTRTWISVLGTPSHRITFSLLISVKTHLPFSNT